MSASASETVALTLARPGTSLFQWMPSATATPAQHVARKRRARKNRPRSLKTSTHWASITFRSAASSLLSSIVESAAEARCEGEPAKVELRNSPLGRLEELEREPRGLFSVRGSSCEGV